MVIAIRLDGTVVSIVHNILADDDNVGASIHLQVQSTDKYCVGLVL
jgi:hypothetical protein